MTPFVSGLVLAAGASRRFGRPKQLLAWRDTTLLGWVVRQALLATRLDELVIVVADGARDVLTGVEVGQARVALASGAEAGCAASYRTGIAGLDPRADGVTIVLGDQPGVDAAMIDRAAQAWRDRPVPILVASYRGRLGHPMVFGRELFPLLGTLSGDKAAWKVVEARHEGVSRVEFDCDYPPDVNTPDDYVRLAEEPRNV